MVPDTASASEVLSAFFSDETEAYRSPSEPDPLDTVSIRLRALKGSVSRAMLLTFTPTVSVLMYKAAEDETFEWYEAKLVSLSAETAYCFIVETGGALILYDRTGPSVTDAVEPCDAEKAFRFTPGFHVPQWAKGALQYQIFTDRFRNGCPENDVRPKEYYYVNGHSMHAESWDALPGDSDIRCFYGGDLQGVAEKLDYLQSLGVEAIYFNPLFVSPSTHKYDIQDYDHIDPHFAVITDDLDHEMLSWEKHNGYAPRYIRRVTSVENLEKSDALFASLCQEMHSRGMKIILDGVFNHCGSFNKWMDREGIYLGKPGYELGAYQDVSSPYRSFFRYSGRGGESRYADYEGWWGHVTLPKLNYEASPKLKEEIFRIAEKWASPPYSIDGWRLDVAADLGHSLEFNHEFWREFRARLKKANPELLIIAEHYGDPSPWLHGDQWDTVMNYDAFMEPVTYFLTGMEKHSDSRRDDLYRNGSEFFRMLLENSARFQHPSLCCAMNELSNHDHSRFLTRTNRSVGRLSSEGSAAAGENVSRAVFMQAVAVQMTLPGSPTIYYGDEAGLTGWTDPDSRRTYPWGHEDEELIALHRAFAGVRNRCPELREGSFKPLLGEDGVIAYARFSSGHCSILICNASEAEKSITLRVADAGIKNGESLSRVIMTSPAGFTLTSESTAPASGGSISFTVPAEASVVYRL